MIECLGEVEDVSAVLPDSVVFVLPTYRDGQPPSMVGALSMVTATPVVATDVPGCHGTVTDRIQAAPDAPAAVQAMGGFIDAPDTVVRMGAASSEVLACFSTHRVNSQILVVLRECLE